MKERATITKRLGVRRGAKSVSSQLRELALAKGAGNKLPTMDELCLEFGTSRATLDNALADLESQNVVLRKRGSGIYVSPKIGYKSIAVVFSQRSVGGRVSSPFWGMMQDLLWRTALERAPQMEHEYTFHLIPFDVPRDNSAARKVFEDLVATGNLDGILCVHPDWPLQEYMQSLDIPVVGYAMGPKVGYGVSYDLVEMFELAADQLARQGCRRVMLIPATKHHPEYREIARRCSGMNPPISLLWENYQEIIGTMPGNDQSFGHKVAMEIFGSPDGLKPDGLIVLEDMVADGIVKALFDLDIRPVRDIRIATHGNTGSPILFGWEDRLTIIESDPAKLVDSMFETLDAILDGIPLPCVVRHIPWTVRLHGAALT